VPPHFAVFLEKVESPLLKAPAATLLTCTRQVNCSRRRNQMLFTVRRFETNSEAFVLQARESSRGCSFL
jgi:hypothetical protein